MSDIVDMLRALADEHYEMLRDIHKPLLEAAAEIERLRALVEWRPIETAKFDAPYLVHTARGWFVVYSDSMNEDNKHFDGGRQWIVDDGKDWHPLRGGYPLACIALADFPSPPGKQTSETPTATPSTDTAVAAVMSLMEWEQSTGKEAVARQIVKAVLEAGAK